MKHLIPSILLCLALFLLPATRAVAGPVQVKNAITTEEAVVLTEQQAESIVELQQIVAGDNKTIWVGFIVVAAVAAAAIITATQ
jgi:hypothetical protein